MNSRVMIYSVAVVTFTVMNMYCQIWSSIDQKCIRIERRGWQLLAPTYDLCIVADFLFVPNIRLCFQTKFKVIKRRDATIIDLI